jgi:maltooligosyltrehalose trehalohydrolase
MHRFEVWAPRPDRVELVLDQVRTPMQRGDDGWWWAEVTDAGPGTRYGYSLDGGPPRPDPRSMHQPDGVDGLSAVVDHGAFAWTDHAWRGVPLAGAVLYELHVGTFSDAGTFDGAIEHLPHLVELGVDAVELLPVAEFSGSRGWGYDGVDLFAPHHAYGGPDGLKRFVDACHEVGLGVVMDVVYNHLGPSGNHLAAFGPYFTDTHQTPWGDAVSYDAADSGEVRRFVVDNALHWLRDFHCDGLRLDAVHAIVDDSATHLLEEIATAVHALGAQVRKPLWVVAESDRNDPHTVRSTEAGGQGLDGAWADDLHHAIHVALTGESSGYYEDFVAEDALPVALQQAWLFDGRWSPARRRVHGRSPAGLPPHRFVVCTQNHDQVGNRALGERLSQLVSPDRLRIAAALLLTTPFTPLLWQGEEWGASTPFQYFTDHADPDLGRAVSEGRRGEFAAFGWDPEQVPDPQDPATFERSKLAWEELEAAPHAELLDWYRRLIRLRREVPDITDPRVTTDASVDGGLVLVRRGALGLAANLGSGAASVEVPHGAEVLLGSPNVDHDPADQDVHAMRLPLDSVVLWHQAARRTPVKQSPT